jgi:hypothetical protein
MTDQQDLQKVECDICHGTGTDSFLNLRTNEDTKSPCDKCNATGLVDIDTRHTLTCPLCPNCGFELTGDDPSRKEVKCTNCYRFICRSCCFHCHYDECWVVKCAGCEKITPMTWIGVGFGLAFYCQEHGVKKRGDFN